MIAIVAMYVQGSYHRRYLNGINAEKQSSVRWSFSGGSSELSERFFFQKGVSSHPRTHGVKSNLIQMTPCELDVIPTLVVVFDVYVEYGWALRTPYPMMQLFPCLVSHVSQQD